jgi:hypothetical protein
VLDECFAKTVQFLCSGPVLENLESCQATAKKLADIFFIAAQFDEIKVWLRVLCPRLETRVFRMTFHITEEHLAK